MLPEIARKTINIFLGYVTCTPIHYPIQSNPIPSYAMHHPNLVAMPLIPPDHPTPSINNSARIKARSSLSHISTSAMTGTCVLHFLR